MYENWIYIYAVRLSNFIIVEIFIKFKKKNINYFMSFNYFV